MGVLRQVVAVGQHFAREAAVHFGLYLKKRGIISAEQLVDALEVQLNTLVPIGQLALEEGILSVRDIFTILRAQSDSPHERFGELAIELGLMTRDELMRLLMIQADRKRSLSEILVWQGMLTERRASTELAAYRRASDAAATGSHEDQARPSTASPREALSDRRSGHLGLIDDRHLHFPTAPGSAGGLQLRVLAHSAQLDSFEPKFDHFGTPRQRLAPQKRSAALCVRSKIHRLLVTITFILRQ